MKSRRILSLMLAAVLLMTMLSGITAMADDQSEQIVLKVNIANGNKSRTITYNQETPLTLPDGTVVTAGMLKPVWSHIASTLNIDLQDVTVQDQKATDMIQTASTNAFADAQIFGGSGISNELMYYGTEGKMVNLSTMMAEGRMPNFKAYLDANPDVRKSITAYDGSIYYVPYIAEINNYARVFVVRESWVTSLLDAAEAAYDTNDFATYYDGFYVGENARTGNNGGVVTPKEGVNVTKKTAQSIIEIQNALEVKNGETLTKAMIQYIADNYDYEHPSELFLGEKAAYDIDELIALMRCIKANPVYLTEGKAAVVWPMFTRQASYREDLLRLGTYFGGVKAHGADSYEARWYIDAEGQLQYTYSTEGMYDVLTYLSAMEAEGLIYSDCYDLTNKTNFRTTLWGTDASATPSYGFITYDWKASSTADTLNSDTVVVLPPVAKVNGVWQYYIDNGRAIKTDGWAISLAGCKTDAELSRACALLDYFFSDEGFTVQNFGLPMFLEEGETYLGPDGIEYPKYTPWVVETAGKVAKGDLSTFLRDWIGSLIPIGYQKSIGFEYQYTSQRGFDGWALVQNSTTGFATYAGEGPEGENPNYYKMTPPVYSLTARQQEEVASNTAVQSPDTVEYMFNIVRYNEKGNAPAGVTIPANYQEYLAYFQSKGLDTYVSNYQIAYMIMTMTD